MNQVITAAEAHERIGRHIEVGRGGEMTLQVVTFNPGTVGGTPTVPVKQIGPGIDWDHGKLMLYPAQPLTALKPEDVAAIHKSAREGKSWHAYQAHKALHERIRALEAELAALKQGGV